MSAPDTSNLLMSRPWAVWCDQMQRFAEFLNNPNQSGSLDILCPSVDETDITWWATGELATVTDSSSLTVTFTGQSRFGPTATVIAGGAGYTSAPDVNISGANGTGMGMTAHALVLGGAVVDIVFDTNGYGYMEPLSFALTGGDGSGALVAGKVGRQFNVGDFILWNDPTIVGDGRSYEIDKITALTPIDDTTATFTLERRPNGAPAGQAQFASQIRSHGTCEIYRLVNKIFPITPGNTPQIYKFLWPDMTVCAAQGNIVGFDATTINLAQPPFAEGTTAVDPRTNPPCPGLRTLNGAAYVDIGILGDLAIGQTAIARISVQDWESIRTVYARVRVPPSGPGTFRGDVTACIVAYVMFISPPDGMGAREVGLIDTLVVRNGGYMTYSTGNQPDGRMMPYHVYWPLDGTRQDWPPTRLPKCIDALDGDENLIAGFTIDPAQTVLYRPDGEIDIILGQVGLGSPGTDFMVTVQS